MIRFQLLTADWLIYLCTCVPMKKRANSTKNNHHLWPENCVAACIHRKHALCWCFLILPCLGSFWASVWAVGVKTQAKLCRVCGQDSINIGTMCQIVDKHPRGAAESLRENFECWIYKPHLTNPAHSAFKLFLYSKKNIHYEPGLRNFSQRQNTLKCILLSSMNFKVLFDFYITKQTSCNQWH